MRPHLPLNALRAFESSARHLSFTRAALELSVTQAAVSQQVRMLEERLGTALFKRLPRGLGITDEGRALLPVLSDAFGRIESVLKQFEGGHFHEVLTVGVVGTFAVGWLMPRLKSFRATHPFVELRLLTHNNLVDLAAEGLDFAIRFGEGIWPTTHNELLLDAPLTVLCAPEIAATGHARESGKADPAALVSRGRMEPLARRRRARSVDGQWSGVRFVAPDGGSRRAGRRGGVGAAAHVRARIAGPDAGVPIRHAGEHR
jgi:DNA-binding transcriptional LysR family regulator